MADYRVLMNSEAVRNKASQIDAKRMEMQGILSDIDSKMTELQGYFKSDAGRKYYEQYGTLKKDIQGGLNRIQAHGDKLRKAADEFDILSKDTTNKVNALDNKGIF